MILRSLLPYPGSKRKSCYINQITPLIQGCTGLVEPFGGSGAVSFRFPELRHTIAESDPWVRSIWECAMQAKRSRSFRQQFTSEILNWQVAIMANPDAAWTEMEFLLDHGECEAISISMAAISLIYRKVCHGNIVRCSKKGLNSQLSQEKVMALERWDSDRWLDSIPFKSVAVYDDYRLAIAHHKAKSKSLCFIDPPYFVTKEYACTPCYPDHDPYARSTLNLCTDAVRLALRGKYREIVITNYYTDVLNNELSRLALGFQRQISMQALGGLGTIGNRFKGRLEHGRRSTKKKSPVECLWVFSDRVQQLQLFSF